MVTLGTNQSSLLFGRGSLGQRIDLDLVRVIGKTLVWW